MSTPDLSEQNVKKIADIFPSVITEKENEDGNIVKAIDFDLLKQVLSKEIVEGGEERYRLDWPGKKASILKANTPITDKTLRPAKEESVGFDNTENLYLEGDNFQVLKLLQESYLNKVKIIYIDPPYNTGKDFVYRDNFTQDKEEYNEEIGATDDEGNKLFKNTETNGRFHSDWLSMMYERLVVARDLLRDDGVVFISIDDNEQVNLKKICDEIFGENNFIASIPRTTSFQRSGQEAYMNVSHDYILCYAYCSDFYNIIERSLDISKIKEDKNGKYVEGDTKAILAAVSQGYSAGGDYDFYYNGKKYSPIDSNGNRNRWLWVRERMQAAADLGLLVQTKNTLRMQLYLDKKFSEGSNVLVNKSDKLKFHTADFMAEKYDNPAGTSAVKDLFSGKELFSNPKPVKLLKDLISLSTEKDSIILDFFSGSATTAHAVMQLNAEDGGNRRFIMAQLPEEVDEKSEAYKAGYKTIAEIGKERIRRAAKKIQDDNKDKDLNKIDFGFRVFKVDSSNMKDVYYNPKDLSQDLLSSLESNIKEDRSPEDLLTQVLLDLGLELSYKIESKDILGNKVFFVEENNLVACFDDNINFSIIDEIAKVKPLKVVFKDASFKDDKDRVNVEERFKRLSPETSIKVI